MATAVLNEHASPLYLLRVRRPFRSFLIVRAADELSSQVLNVAVAWYVYAATHDPMSLAYVGLARFLPNIAMALVAGHAADRFDRRLPIGMSLFLQILCMAILTVRISAATSTVLLVYPILLVAAAAQAFAAPAMSAMLPHLVSADEFPRAVALASSVVQICTLAGPALGGLIYAVSGPGTFALSAMLLALALTQAPRLGAGNRGPGGDSNGPPDGSPLGGIRYVRANRLLLSLVSLDLFAVLLGGVTALLPIYARDIFATGPAGLGCLRCAPGAGAAIMGCVLAHRAIQRGAGKLMLVCVAGFGVATVLFALSTNLWIALAALAGAGAFDMVSMVIRQTLVQTATPDGMRGRVSAVQCVFIGASSELGEFESGVTAALFGTVPAALLGGLGTLAVVAVWIRIFPELMCADRTPDRTADRTATEKTDAR